MKVIEFQNYWGNNMDFELKSVKNFRDLGNIKTKDNKKIKQNLLFRSASLDSLSEDEYLLLKNKCNLQLVIDFRSETSFINKPDKIFSTRKEHLKVYKYLDKQRFDYTIKVTPDEFFFNVYKGFTLTEESIEAYSKFFRLIIDQKEGSIIFHCTSGKDRTGIAAILLLYVLGVDKETIIKEHMKTFNYMYPIFKKELDNIDRIYIVACGTAYHAGLMGKVVIEKHAKIPVEVDIASEFRYRDPLVTDKSLIITVSQSGETADTLAVLRDCKKKGARTLAITNVVGSTISREADYVIYTAAGPEIAVASTKAYTTQLIIMYALGLYFGELKGTIDDNIAGMIKEGLLEIPEKIEELLTKQEQIQKVASILSKESDLFFLGRGADYFLVLEGSLKLKEISYIHSEAYAGGELKHGPIALIENGTKVVVLLTQEALREKMVSNVVEVKARGAYVIGVAYEGDKLDSSVFDEVISIPRTSNRVAPVLAAVVLQLLAYYTAKEKGYDIDKPRNLAKSVTVE